MKKYTYILMAGLCGLMFTGCLADFQELNTDPEQLGNADPRNVFTGATENYGNSSRAHLTGKYSGVMIYMQYLVSYQGANAGYYVNTSKPNEHPQPSMQAYNDYFSNVGLRLDYLINTVIGMQGEDAAKYADVGAVAQLLLSYKQWQMLDTYGAAPVLEAFKAQSLDIRTPRYDLYQENVEGEPMYKYIDNQVKEAVATLNRSDANQYNLGNNDFFFKGDVKKWVKFGNTLRVKMAQRLEKMDNAFYNSVIGEVAGSASNLIASNDESCIYWHANDYNNNIDDIQDITSRYCASKAFVDYLKNHNDPRLPIMVRRNGFGLGNNNNERDENFELFEKEYPNFASAGSEFARYAPRYVGMSANPSVAAGNKYDNNAYLTVPYTKEDGTTANLDIRMFSQIESRYYIKNGGGRGNNNMPLRDIEESDFILNQDALICYTPLITYPETCFMMAEIAVKKGAAVAGKDATAWMREGIRASMEQYRTWAGNMGVVAQTVATAANYDPVTDADIAAYLARPEFQSATLEKIIAQQWINLYMQPEEMWATWKRTGLPAFSDNAPANGVAYLERIQDTGVNLVIPRRNSLPTPNTMNIDNFNAAVDKLKSDAKYGSDRDRTEGRIWWDKE